MEPRLLCAAKFQVCRSVIFSALELSSSCFAHQVGHAVPQLFNVDFEVRQGIFKCLESLTRTAKETPRRTQNIVSTSDLAYQLAFCYKLGFGVPRDEDKCRMWLADTDLTNSDLENQIDHIKSSTSQGYSPTSTFGFWYSHTPVPTVNNAQYYRERKKLKDIQQIEEREIGEWKEVLGKDHWLFLEKEESYFHTLSSLGYLSKAGALAEKRCRDLSSTLPREDDRVLRARCNLAEVFLDQRRHDEAEREVLEVIELSNSTDYNHAVHQNLLASIYTARGRYKKAIALRQEIHDNYVATLGDSHIETLNVLLNL